MKKGLFLTLALALIIGSVSAQSIKLTRKLTRDEVPVTIMQSFERDYSSLTEKGTWTLVYNQDSETRKLTPLLYTYNTKKDGQKIEVSYKPDATIDHATGVSAPAGE